MPLIVMNATEIENLCIAELNVVVNGDVIGSFGTKTVQIGKNLRVVAPEEYEGYTFSHWEYNGKTIPSTELIVRVSTGSMILDAVYVSDTGDTPEMQLVYVSETFSELVNGTKKVCATLAYGNLPEGAVVTEVGFYRSRTKSDIIKDETNPSNDDPATLKGKYTAVAPSPRNGSYTLHISSKSNTFGIWVRAYITYKIGDSDPQIVLDNAVYCLDWSEEDLR